MRYAATVFLVGVVLVGCRDQTSPTESTGPEEQCYELPKPTIVRMEARLEGTDLRIHWTSSEGAEAYRLYCDGNLVYDGADTTYTIRGADMVCATVEVRAVCGEYVSAPENVSLRAVADTVVGVVSHDLTGSAWVKITFAPDFSARAISQAYVDPTLSNTGYFVLYNNAGTPEMRDASATSIGTVKMELAFSDNSSGDIAPGTGNYSAVRSISAGGFYFFWADNTATGYGDMDANDYFGAVEVTSLSNSGGGYTANFVIYAQTTVPGLRWLRR